MKKLVVLISVMSLLMVLSGCSCSHEWTEADCVTPRTCSACGETEGEALGHDWNAADCVSDAECSRCGEKGEKATGHIWSAVTCTSPGVCEVCGTSGKSEMAPHQWISATATTPKVCSVCGKEEGLSLNDEREAAKEAILKEAKVLADNKAYVSAIGMLDDAWWQSQDQVFCDTAADYRFELGIHNASRVAAGESNSAVINEDATVTAVGRNNHGELSAGNWTDITAISLGDSHTVGLKSDGTVLAIGNTMTGRCSVSQWNQIVAVAAGNSHTVALTEEGQLLATGYDEYGQCQVEELMSAAGNRRIVAVAAGFYHTVALLEDGTAVACGDRRFGACAVENWTNLAAICAGKTFTAGLRTDGTVTLSGQGVEDWDVSEWKDIVNLAAGGNYIAGVKADGSVIVTGFNSENLNSAFLAVNGWKDIVYIEAGFDQIVAINSSGEKLCAGANNFGQCDLQQMTEALERGEKKTDRNVTSISMDRFMDYTDEYYNYVGMDAAGEPIWIYMTEHLGNCDEGNRVFGALYVETIGMIEDLFFFWEDHTIIALDPQTGSVVWKHREIDGKSNGQETDSDGSTHIRGYSHDIFVTQDGVPSCAGADGSGKCGLHETVKAKPAAKTASEVRFEHFDEGGETANAVGLDKDGNAVWIYRMSLTDNAMLYRFEEIGQWGNIYYLNECGTVTALDVKTGNVLWQNSDYAGSGTRSWIESNGTVYLTGYLGPDFFAVDAKGNTLHRIQTFDKDYFWPTVIEKKSGKIHITFDEGPETETYEKFLITVNPRDYSYEIIGGINPRDGSYEYED